MFRFRRFEYILDKKELEDQYIYFSSIKKLSDPCEGMAQIVFSTKNYEEFEWIVNEFIKENVINKDCILYKMATGLLSSLNKEKDCVFCNLDTSVLLSLKEEIVILENIINFASYYDNTHFITEQLTSFIKEHLLDKEIKKHTLILFLDDLYNDIRKIQHSYIKHGKIEIKYNLERWAIYDLINYKNDVKRKINELNFDEKQLKNVINGLMNIYCNKLFYFKKRNKLDIAREISAKDKKHCHIRSC